MCGAINIGRTHFDPAILKGRLDGHVDGDISAVLLFGSYYIFRQISPLQGEDRRTEFLKMANDFAYFTDSTFAAKH